jgi:hypothetical protein
MKKKSKSQLPLHVFRTITCLIFFAHGIAQAADHINSNFKNGPENIPEDRALYEDRFPNDRFPSPMSSDENQLGDIPPEMRHAPNVVLVPNVKSWNTVKHLFDKSEFKNLTNSKISNIFPIPTLKE